METLSRIPSESGSYSSPSSVTAVDMPRRRPRLSVTAPDMPRRRRPCSEFRKEIVELRVKQVVVRRPFEVKKVIEIMWMGEVGEGMKVSCQNHGRKRLMFVVTETGKPSNDKGPRARVKMALGFRLRVDEMGL